MPSPPSARSLASSQGSQGSRRSSNRTKESSTYGYSHLPGYAGHRPAETRNLGKLGKTWNNTQSQSNLYTTESKSIGVAAHLAPEIKKAGIPVHEFESRPLHPSSLKWTHHEDYGGHIPRAPRNANNYGKTFGTERQDWKQLTAK